VLDAQPQEIVVIPQGVRLRLKLFVGAVRCGAVRCGAVRCGARLPLRKQRRALKTLRAELWRRRCNVSIPCVPNALNTEATSRITAALMCGTAGAPHGSAHDGDALHARSVVYLPDTLVSAAALISAARFRREVTGRHCMSAMDRRHWPAGSRPRRSVGPPRPVASRGRMGSRTAIVPYRGRELPPALRT